MKYIYGLGISGQSIINYLDLIKEDFCCWDNDSKIRKKLIKVNKNIKLVEPENLNYDLVRESFISPGISLNDDNLNLLKKNKVNLYRD